MYGKEEAKQLKKEFWTSFGIYMKKYNHVYGRKINWVNYKTKIKDVYFRLNADKTKATFAIEIQHKDEGIRNLFFDQFEELKGVLNDSFENPLTWERETLNDFKIPVSKIGCVYAGINVFDKNTWRDAFHFMEKNIINAHEFWNDFNEIFKQLE